MTKLTTNDVIEYCGTIDLPVSAYADRVSVELNVSGRVFDVVFWDDADGLAYREQSHDRTFLHYDESGEIDTYAELRAALRD